MNWTMPKVKVLAVIVCLGYFTNYFVLYRFWPSAVYDMPVGVTITIPTKHMFILAIPLSATIAILLILDLLANWGSPSPSEE